VPAESRRRRQRHRCRADSARTQHGSRQVRLFRPLSSLAQPMCRSQLMDCQGIVQASRSMRPPIHLHEA